MATTILEQVIIPDNLIALTKIKGWGPPISVCGVLSPTSGSKIAILYAEDVDFTVQHEDAAALVEDRIITPDGVPYYVAFGQAVFLIYDTDVSRWRVISIP